MTNKRFAFFDVDKTIYDGYSTPDFLKYLAAHDIVDKSVVDEYAKLDLKLWEKEITYSAITEESTALFAHSIKGLKDVTLQFYEDDFFQKQGRLFLWVPKVMDYLYEKKFEIILISATVHPILDTFARFLPITNYFGSQLEIKDGIYTGNVISTLNNTAKSEMIKKIIGDIDNEAILIGFGDSPGDIDMLKGVNLAFVINPHDDEMVAEVSKNNWNTTMDANIMIDRIEKKFGNL